METLSYRAPTTTAMGQLQQQQSLPATLALSNVSPATRLLEKRRQMFEVQEALEAAKQEFARKEEGFRQREDVLKRRDLELQESLIRFSRFLQENDAKRARAEKKALEEAKARASKEAEISELNEAVEALTEERERIDAVVDKRMRYQRYLESVVEAADEYEDISDLLARHATLQATNADLRAHMAQCDEGAERARSELLALHKSQGDELLALNNRLAELKQELEAHEQEAAQHEAAKDGALQVASQRTLEYGQVVLATDNLYAQCRQLSHITRAAHAGPLQHLEVIGNFISDLAAACAGQQLDTAAAREKSASNLLASAAETAAGVCE